MTKQTIRKSIEINAPTEKVWHVLLQDKYNRIWYAEFMEGSHAETDWNVGSKVLFKDSKGQGLASRVIVNKPREILSIQHEADLKDGIEDTESDEAKKWKGLTETYLLKANGNHTQLAIEHEIADEYYEVMLAAWDKVFLKIKDLSESD